jgi:hypothetical protein
MIKPTTSFWYEDEKIAIKKNVPVTLASDENANAMIAHGVAEEYEEVHPNGNFNITTKGTFDVKQYATVTVNPTIYVVTLWGGQNLTEFSYLPFVAGESKSLPTEGAYLNVYDVEEGKHFAGWSTSQNNVETKIEGELKPTQDMNIYALILDNVEEEEEEEDNNE